MAFSKTLSQVLVLHTKKITESTRPVYATLDNLQELFPFILPFPLRGNQQKCSYVSWNFFWVFLAKIRGVKRTLSHIYLPAKFQDLSCN